jgi:hypothetical protein
VLCSTRAQWSAPFAVEYLSCTARVTSSRGAGGSPHEPGAGVGAPGRRGRGAARRSRVLPVTRPSHATTLRSPFRLTHVQLFTLHTSARRSAYRRAHRTPARRRGALWGACGGAGGSLSVSRLLRRYLPVAVHDADRPTRLSRLSRESRLASTLGLATLSRHTLLVSRASCPCSLDMSLDSLVSLSLS